MKPLEIKGELISKGFTLTNIAKHLRVSVSIVSQVIYNKAVSSKVRKHISEILGKPISQIWESK